MFVLPWGCNLSASAPFDDPTRVPEINSAAIDGQLSVNEASEAEFQAALGIGSSNVAQPVYEANGVFIKFLTKSQIALYNIVLKAVSTKLQRITQYGGKPNVTSNKLKALFVSNTSHTSFYIFDVSILTPMRLFGTHLRLWCCLDSSGTVTVDDCKVMGRFTSDATFLDFNDPNYNANLRLFPGRFGDYSMPLAPK